MKLPPWLKRGRGRDGSAGRTERALADEASCNAELESYVSRVLNEAWPTDVSEDLFDSKKKN